MCPLNYIFNEKKIRKIRIIFDIENWLWSAIFHSIKLLFDAEVAENILNGILITYIKMKPWIEIVLIISKETK